MYWKNMSQVSPADERRVRRIADSEGLRVWTGQVDVTADKVRARANAAHKGFFRQIGPQSMLAQRVADLRWLADFLADQENDIDNGLAVLRRPIDDHDDERAERTRDELHARYPYVKIS